MFEYFQGFWGLYIKTKMDPKIDRENSLKKNGTHHLVALEKT